MPNKLDATGLTTMTKDELVTLFTTTFQQIYGPDIDLSQSSPDGQLMMTFIQTVLDIQDLLTQIYNSFDPDTAIGTQLDQRVAMNGIERQGGTFTQQPINITTTTALTLYGLDQTLQPVYTVADNTGNQWQLLTTQVIGGPGTNTFLFQAAQPGNVVPIPNTINVPVTIVLGVSAINNPAPPSILGTNEETDAALRIRRQISTAIPSQGYFDGLLAALQNVPGIISAFVQENFTDATDAFGVPAHSIWVIVKGTYNPADVAQAIYTERTLGCGMRGEISYVIVQLDGSNFTVVWDNYVPQDIFIRFVATSINGIDPPEIQQILTNLPSIFVPGVAQTININELATAVQSIDPNTLVTVAGLSTAFGGPFSPTLIPTDKRFQFVILTQNIYILPVLLLPIATSIPVTTTNQFQAYGGSQIGYNYTITVNNTGGSIGLTSGLYTAGATPGVDTIRVIDSDGNTAFSTITAF